MYKICILVVSIVTFQRILCQEESHCIGPYCPDFSFPDKVLTSDISCNGTKQKAFKNPDDCHSFFLCSGDTENATKLVCPSDYGYHELWRMCVPEDQLQTCGGVVCPTYIFDGVLPDPKDCTRYYRCMYGFRQHEKCPRKSVFEAERGICKSYRRGQEPACLKKPTPVTTTTFAPTTEAIATTVNPIVENSTSPVPSSV